MIHLTKWCALIFNTATGFFSRTDAKSIMPIISYMDLKDIKVQIYTYSVSQS
jgi:hypothetical protein